MFKLHVYSQSGDLDQHVVIEGDSATIGRSTDCNVVIDRKDISRLHARLLRGWVVDDLASRNGTHVDGVKIDAATAIEARCFEIGDPASDNLVTIEVVGVDRPEGAPPPQDLDVTRTAPKRVPDVQQAATVSIKPMSAGGGGFPPRAELEAVAEQYRSKCAQLELELSEMRRRMEALEKPAAARDELAETKEQLRRLQERVEKLTQERGG